MENTGPAETYSLTKWMGAGGICSENISNALGWSGQSILSTTADAKRVPLGITLSVILSSISFTQETWTEQALFWAQRKQWRANKSSDPDLSERATKNPTQANSLMCDLISGCRSVM